MRHELLNNIAFRHRRDCDDLILVGSSFTLYAVSSGILMVPLFLKQGGPKVPPQGLKQTRISVCGNLIVFATLEPEQADCPLREL